MGGEQRAAGRRRAGAKAAVVPQSARHYRAVTPTVSPPDRLSPDIWRRACEQRGMMTTAQRMNELAPLHYEQVRQVHKEKQGFFSIYTLPSLAWTDLSSLTDETSRTQKQPAFFGVVAGPPRMGVHSKRRHTPVDVSATRSTSMSLTGRSSRWFGT
mmetsp:Transcript_129889/g.363530  ORF Transcript_129889/g.363530 Transcript_129889/m.363530 type:complete len:156 (+) Transcript_129889:82-549(+)